MSSSGKHHPDSDAEAPKSAPLSPSPDLTLHSSSEILPDSSRIPSPSPEPFRPGRMPTTSPLPRLPEDSPRPANYLQMFISPSEMPVPHTPGSFAGFQVGLSNPPNLSQMNPMSAIVSPLPDRQMEAFRAHHQLQAMSNTQPVRYTGLPESAWEGALCPGFSPGYYGDFIVSANFRAFHVLLEVKDKEIGPIYLLNRGYPWSHFQKHSCIWLNNYRIAVTCHQILFICEISNKVFSVQACLKNAKSFQSISPVKAWEAALSAHYTGRSRFLRLGQRYFGMGNEIICSNCEGMRAGPTTTKKERKPKQVRKAKSLDDEDYVDNEPPLRRPGTSAPKRSQTERKKPSKADHQIPEPDDYLIANQQRQNMLDDEEFQQYFPQKPYPWEEDVDGEFDSENGL
ncbi:hypothetical protein BLNAU_18458 [Blattamonas nauphoetae]|uniref:Uncharacterized protein n=1 Tax=Blattamonas nauphoetae TaxID=2049346 RepID=A0ABQ9X4C2_9EUKA|nr:hypothetical protein BLNAU_18458 [Blattamonas nauphoetae]